MKTTHAGRRFDGLLRAFRTLSFTRKILFYVGIVSFLSLALASLAFMIYDAYSIRQLLV